MKSFAALAIVLAAVLPTTGCTRLLQKRVDAAKTARAEADIATLGLALTTYQTLGRKFPSTAQGLGVLIAKPTTEPLPAAWTQQMSDVPVDPWGHAYQYVQPGVHNPTSFDLYSAGPDGKPGTVDDIKNWK